MDFSKRFHIRPGHKAKLDKIDPAATWGFDKKRAKERVKRNIKRIFKLQYRMYAENKYSLLVVLQGMDCAGKDGVIRHVMRGLNPQGCTVTPFKSPSSEELDHDFLWRIHKAVPAKGDIAIFNRSHYEDVLIARVKQLASKPVIESRYDQINAFERMLTENGIVVLKFFLYISKEEQRERLIARLRDPEKNWKFNENDLKEREHWDAYMHAYDITLRRCSTKSAPWFVVPADKKWFRDLVISEIIVETLLRLDLKLPPALPGISKLKVI